MAGLRPVAGGRVLICRDDLEKQIMAAGVDDPTVVLRSDRVVGWLEGGRTRHARIDAAGESWVLKAYRRGGCVGLVNADRYWGTRRFLRELDVAAAASAMGVATADLIALVFEDAGLRSVRAWLVSNYLPGVSPLTEKVGRPGEIAVFAAAGELVARMHRAGIDHPDLHLGNIVGRSVAGRAQVFVIDWDRARRRPIGSWNPLANLNRLWRSVRKGVERGVLASGDRAGAAVSGREPGAGGVALRAFVRGYFRRQPRLLRQARQYLRHRAVFLALRTLVWRSSR